MKELVSIIIPVYNSEEYIEQCIESLINQTYEEIEIIIVNDGSTDNSERIIEKYKVKDNRIVYFPQKNSGPSVARNQGISIASGKYILFVDSDDKVESSYVELLVDAMELSSSDLVCCGYKDFSEFGVIEHHDFPFNKTTSKEAIIEFVCQGTGGVLWSKLFKREIIMEHKLLMDKDIFMSEDLIFVLEYVCYCSSFSSINTFLYHYNRLNQNSISANISSHYLGNFIMVCKKIEGILGAINYPIKEMKWIVKERIQTMVIILIEQQVLNLNGNKAKINEVREMVCNDPYIDEYRLLFQTDKMLYKPLIFLLKKENIGLSIKYGYCIALLKRVKRSLSRKGKIAI